MANEYTVTALSAYDGILGRIGSRTPYGRSNCYHKARDDAKKLAGHEYLPAGSLL